MLLNVLKYEMEVFGVSHLRRREIFLERKLLFPVRLHYHFCVFFSHYGRFLAYLSKNKGLNFDFR